jgi:predicted nucleic acid-binding Zn ribbon protein
MIKKRETCLYCGEKMESKSAKKLYCSDKCRIYYQREKARGTLGLDIAIKNGNVEIVKAERETVIPTKADIQKMIDDVQPKGLHEKSNQTKIAEYEEELKHLGNSSVAIMRKKFLQKQIQILKK